MEAFDSYELNGRKVIIVSRDYYAFLSLESNKRKGMNDRYREYLLSDEWKSIRLTIIEDREQCERCGSDYKLQIHHKNYDNIFNELDSDLELLCKRCHLLQHNLLKPRKPKTKWGCKRKAKWAKDEKRRIKVLTDMKNARNLQAKFLNGMI